jgi:putative nucleotidyltransferase with HDIG domain
MNHTYHPRYTQKAPEFTERSVKDCTHGDILASDVFNLAGCKLLSANTEINGYIKDHLSLNGIRRVNIYSCGEQPGKGTSDEIAVNDYRNAVICLKGIFLDVTAGRALDFGRIKQISNVVVKHSGIQNNANIIKFIHKIRSADGYTYTHSVHVAFYSLLLAVWLQFSEEDTALAFQAGLLHDVGKIKIPKSILKKPGSLTAEEFDVIKTHTTLGFDFVDIPQVDSRLKQAVLSHHERLNGSGYPLGIIPEDPFARIVAIADVYDAMTSDRVYKKGVTPFKAFNFLLSEGLALFDSHMLHIFVSNLTAYLTGSRVLLADGETAALVYIPPDNPERYILRAESGTVNEIYTEIVAIL